MFAFLLHPRKIWSICLLKETLWRLRASICSSSSAFQLHLWAAPWLHRDRSVPCTSPDLGKANNAIRGCSNLILRAAKHRFESFSSYFHQTKLQQVQQMLSSGRSQKEILRVFLPVWERIKIRTRDTNSAGWLMTCSFCSTWSLLRNAERCRLAAAPLSGADGPRGSISEELGGVGGWDAFQLSQVGERSPKTPKGGAECAKRATGVWSLCWSSWTSDSNPNHNLVSRTGLAASGISPALLQATQVEQLRYQFQYQPAFKTKNVLLKKANAVLQLSTSELAYPHN